MTPSKKIAIISEHASPIAPLGGPDSGGQNVYVAQVAKHLARRGHHVDIFTRRDDPHIEPIIELGNHTRVIHVPAGPAEFVPKEQLLPHMDEFCNHVVEFCRTPSARYDLTHANFFMSGLASLALRKAYGTPFCMTFHALGKVRRIHQGNADQFPIERIAIEERLVAQADSLIAECPQDRIDLMTHYRADKDRIDIVPCGFDADEFSPGPATLRKELGIGDDEFVVLQLGRLVLRKGIDNVIRGIADLKHRYGITARLLIVGGDGAVPDSRITPEIARLAGIASLADVSDQVMFIGSRPRHELRRYYNAADVFVSTPWYEPFGITPLEAMACGCPVIGSAVGGIQYSVADKITGFLVPPNDPQRLADRLAALQQDPSLRLALGQAGLERVSALFTWREVAEKLDSVYARIAPSQTAVSAVRASMAATRQRSRRSEELRP